MACGERSAESRVPLKGSRMAARKPPPLFQVGDRVKIRHTDWRGRIVEFRSPLGPGGALIYGIRVPGKPKATYIEVREDQLILLPKPEAKPSTAEQHCAPEKPRKT
jgi:hypothetical protein